MDKLVFGTDGWRDIIGERYTYSNVARAAQAYAEHLIDQRQDTAVVGHDTRFNGDLFARVVAEVLAANGLRTLLAATYLPTPALSFAVKHYQAGGGVMLTASHNPPAYNGFKLKGPYGGTATETIYRDVANRVEHIGLSDVKPFERGRHEIERLDVREAYYQWLSELVDLKALRHFRGTLVHDAMGGAAGGWLKGFVEQAGLPIEVVELHSQPHPQFYGVNPEPLPQNLGELSQYMKRVETGFAVATDGDGDRLGVVLPGGDFFNSHQIFTVLLDLMSCRGARGHVVKTFTVSRTVERLATARGLDVVETPVGFKYIVDAMLEGDVMVGGEESGGIGVAGHIPERDGIANGLLLAEAVVKRDTSLADLFASLEQEASWKHAYDRLDLHLQGNELKDAVMQSLVNPPDAFAGRRVESVETRDGCKLNLSENAWVLFRPSGTEPVLRIYCEAATSEDVATILAEADRYANSFG
jgi:phosphomannomutase